MDRVSIEEVRAAAELLRGVARYTPMESSRPLALAIGGPVHLKCENLQRTGSFKIRGAYVRIARLPEAEKAAGVVAASAGNHAQGVALAASLVGSTSKVYMPVGASIAKLTATRAYGADVELVGESLDDALESAHALWGAIEVGRELGPDALLLVNLSGRGDKDMHTAAEWFGLVDEGPA